MQIIKSNQILILLVSILLISCKQNSFLNRRYTDGSYHSNSKTLHLKDIHSQKASETERSETMVEKKVPYEPLTDTIILNNGKRIPCKVKQIDRNRITYIDNAEGYWGSEKFVTNKNAKRIDFKGNQKEYFTEEDPSGNPLLQYGLFEINARKNGMAIFGAVVTLTTGMFLLAASIPVALIVITLGLFTLINVTSAPTNSGKYKGFNAFGKFMGFVTLFALLLLLIILVALL
jgi:hypothetical protein